jgi:hypothetical protein
MRLCASPPFSGSKQVAIMVNSSLDMTVGSSSNEKRTFTRLVTVATRSFRLHPAERRVGQARHLVIAFTRSNGA